MTFNAAETAACRHLVELALAEDLGTTGDLTSQAVIPADFTGHAAFVARSPGVLAGLPAAEFVLQAVDPHLHLQTQASDGDSVQPGQQLATIHGPMRGILTSERTALNFMQRLSGVATLTRTYVEAIAGLPCQVLDTRKTTPGWRLLEKYAVRCGGAHNHRIGLYDGILLKDNHLAALKDAPCGPVLKTGLPPIKQAVKEALRHAGPGVPVEIEVDTLDQLNEALACGPAIVLLDNMTLPDLREAVRRRDAIAPKVLLEASGGVSLTTVRAIAETGVDRISVGALTHSAPALDIALDYLS